jgi:parvulin-like peptidyl-prolyl isomerase
MTRDNPQLRDTPLPDDEIAQARELYAKLRISEKSAKLQPEPFRSAAAFKARLQQMQFLARLYAATLAKKTAVSDSEVTAFIAAHPEFAVATKKAAAENILQRAKAGENFATLANEFSEDPGNNSSDGVKNGGLYSDVPVGMMVPAFEKASLSLNAGQIYPTVVESDFGYHVIKLENKTSDGQKYDVRHILISTAVKDPNHPGAREVPVAMFVRAKLESEREDIEFDKIVAENPVVVEDYKPPVKGAVKAPAKKRVVRKKR